MPINDRPADSLLRPGETCWRTERADAVGFLLDAQAYYQAFVAAVRAARRSILILGWDIHSRTVLDPENADSPAPLQLGSFLSDVVSRRPGLHCHVLSWDFAALFAFERELLPRLRLGWQTHRRIHFELDDEHPAGASHHQKIVVVDDQVAFSGGLDLTIRRWDTPDHAPEDRRRADPAGALYPPFHDVQIAVSGPAAAALGDLARERWRRATGQTLRAPKVSPEGGGDAWPVGLVPDLRNVAVGIVRTEPAHEDRPPVLEVERLFLESIAAARHTIFLENQYLTSERIGQALGERLREPDGPEIVVVVPRHCSGWLEKETMGVLRAHLLYRLQHGDPYDRFRAYYPRVKADDDAAPCLDLHSKVMVIDDRLVRVGSANLSNRSLSLDTECDLAVESGSTARAEDIVRLRDRLLGEHLGRRPQEISAELRRQGSLIRTIEALRGGERTLVPLPPTTEATLEPKAPGIKYADPEQPLALDDMVREMLPADQPRRSLRTVTALAVAIVVCIVLVLLWRQHGLPAALDPGRIVAFMAPWRDNPWGPLLAVGFFVAASLLFLPLTLLIAQTAFVFGPLVGLTCSLVGALVAAVAAFGLGRLLGRDAIRLGGRRARRVRHRLSKSGVLAVAAIRLVPIAPYAVVNLVAGAVRVPLRSFVVGTVLGLLPGLLTLTLVGSQLGSVLAHPHPGRVAWVVALGVALALGVVWLRRHGLRRSQARPAWSGRAAAPARDA